MKIKTTVVQPKVSTAQLAKKYPAVLIVDRGAFKLTLYKNLKKAKTYGIAVGPGRPGHARGPVLDPEQGRQSGLACAELRLGGRPGGQGDRRR